jgi:hypothetical protein
MPLLLAFSTSLMVAHLQMRASEVQLTEWQTRQQSCCFLHGLSVSTLVTAPWNATTPAFFLGFYPKYSAAMQDLWETDPSASRSVIDRARRQEIDGRQESCFTLSYSTLRVWKRARTSLLTYICGACHMEGVSGVDAGAGASAQVQVWTGSRR